jgi:hypothetical protein
MRREASAYLSRRVCMVNSPRILEIGQRLDLLQQHAGRQLMISRHFLMANVGRHFVLRHPASRCSVLVHSGIILATRLRSFFTSHALICNDYQY